MFGMDLKPVQRRILYAMYDSGNTPDKPYRKSAKTVGDVMGNYHPHGDSSIYEGMVRMAQPWKMGHMLVDGHGNWGSMDDDPPAAMRYTEARLSPIAMELLRDIEKRTVLFKDNFDNTTKEPVVLPSRYPNLLVNGVSGISSGFATEIPPHNLREVINACIAVDEQSGYDLEELMEIVKGPDFPTGGIIMGEEGIREAYRNGQRPNLYPFQNSDRGYARRQAANRHHGNSLSGRQVQARYGDGKYSAGEKGRRHRRGSRRKRTKRSANRHRAEEGSRCARHFGLFAEENRSAGGLQLQYGRDRQ